MSQYGFNSKRESISKIGLTVDKFKDFIKGLCDEDFNGNNGEDYYIPVDDDNGKESLKSRFEVEWDIYVSDNTNIVKDGASIADSILNEAYSYDENYYLDYMIEVVDTPDEIIAIIAYMDYI